MSKKISHPLEIKTLWTLLCQNPIIDQQTNQISLFNVLEDIQFDIKGFKKEDVEEGKVSAFKQKTMIPYPFALVTEFERNEENLEELHVELKITIIDPLGAILSVHTPSVTLEKGKKRMRIITRFEGVEVTRSGTYTYETAIRTKDSDIYQEQGEAKIDVKVSF
ncbi:MAG: hypothetical protein WC629_02150 [Candidatus Paceibacterota bacterium]|jgi:hypothetical protein